MRHRTNALDQVHWIVMHSNHSLDYFSCIPAVIWIMLTLRLTLYIFYKNLHTHQSRSRPLNDVPILTQRSNT